MYIYPKAAGSATLERRFKYSFMGMPICKQVFWCILGVNERTMRAWKHEDHDRLGWGDVAIFPGSAARGPCCAWLIRISLPVS